MRVKQLCLSAGLLAMAPVVDHAQPAAVTWQGSFLSQGETHRMVLQADQGTDGRLTVRSIAVDFLPEAVGLETATIQDDHLVALTNTGKGLLDARLSQSGTVVDGTWTWAGLPAAVTLRRVSGEVAWHTPLNYQYHWKDVTYARPSPDEPRIPFSPRLAMQYLERGATAWTKERGCISCHTNGTYMMVRPLMARDLGPPQQAMHDFWLSELRSALATDPAKRGGKADGTRAVYLAAGLAIWDARVTHRLSPETVQALDLMFQFQRPAGDWRIEDDVNPPFEASPYQVATVAARAVGNAPDWLRGGLSPSQRAHVDLLKRYLLTAQRMQGDYDRTDLLWTATEWPGLLDAKRMRDLVAMIFAHQQFDGGWSIRSFAQPEEWGRGTRAAKLRAEAEFGYPQSDGHMTGLAIIALRKAGVSCRDPRIARGVQWLLGNQRASGRWWTRSLIRDGWQFISYSGTAYPMLALSLCDAVPPLQDEPQLEAIASSRQAAPDL